MNSSEILVVLPVLSALSLVAIYLFFGVRQRKVLVASSAGTWQKFKLISKSQVSHNTAMYKFALPRPTDILGLPVGKHVAVRAVIDGKEVVRSYTPISSEDTPGSFTLLIKTYENGNVSRYLDLLKVGESTVDFKGPRGSFHYAANMSQEILMLAGGTGLTPMLQIIKAILTNPLDGTKISLVYANVTLDDILLKAELDSLFKTHPDRFKIHYVLNNAPKDWTSSIGYITAELIQKHCPIQYSHTSKILICGPPPMVRAMEDVAVSMGFPKPGAVSKPTDAVVKF